MAVNSIQTLRLQYERQSDTGDPEGTSVVNIRLPKWLLTKADEFAKAHGVTRSRYLRDLIEVGHNEMARLVVLSCADGSQLVAFIHDIDPEQAEKQFPEDYHQELAD